MGTFKFSEIAFNSTEKKKPVDEDKYTYLGLEHLDSDSIYVTRYGADVAPKGDKLIMKKGDVLVLFPNDVHKPELNISETDNSGNIRKIVTKVVFKIEINKINI